MASSSGRVMAVFLVGRSPRLTEARRARLSSVLTLGNSHGLARRLSLCALDSTATRWTTVDSFNGPTLALRPAATNAWSTARSSAPGPVPPASRISHNVYYVKTAVLLGRGLPPFLLALLLPW